MVESDYLSQVVGYPDVKLHIVYLGLGDLKHSVELIQYLRPEGDGVAPVPRNYVGAAHLGIIVDDLDATYKELSSRGVKFVSAPAVRPNAQYPSGRRRLAILKTLMETGWSSSSESLHLLMLE